MSSTNTQAHCHIQRQRMHTLLHPCRLCFHLMGIRSRIRTDCPKAFTVDEPVADRFSDLGTVIGRTAALGLVLVLHGSRLSDCGARTAEGVWFWSRNSSGSDRCPPPPGSNGKPEPNGASGLRQYPRGGAGGEPANRPNLVNRLREQLLRFSTAALVIICLRGSIVFAER
jgi:hypothetical protein